MSGNISVLSWNINGLVNHKKLEIVQGYDILMLQEIRTQQIKTYSLLLNYPYQYWNCGEFPGKFGTFIGSKVPLNDVVYDTNFSNEGRCISGKLHGIRLTNVYFPTARTPEKQLKYSQDLFQTLGHCKPQYLFGDWNGVQDARDSHCVTELAKHFEEWVCNGYKDAYRDFYPESKDYTWFSNYHGNRVLEKGWRIDTCLSNIPPVSIEYLPFHYSDHRPIRYVISKSRN